MGRLANRSGANPPALMARVSRWKSSHPASTDRPRNASPGANTRLVVAVMPQRHYDHTRGSFHMPAALRPRTMAALSCLAAAWQASFAVALPKITCSGTELMAF